LAGASIQGPGSPLLVVAGPTASGKTALAIEAALALDAEIVGAASMQVYRHMDIGTAKPTAEQLRGTAHHMLDIVDPDEPYDAARYAHDADRAIAGALSRGKRAILVGGTGLYIRILVRGLHGGPPPDPEIRAGIARRAERDGWPALHEELAGIDPTTAERLHPNDGVRISRALEVSLASGVPMSAWQREHGFGSRRYRALLLVLDVPRDDLDRRIDERVDQMMALGFLGEVRDLIERGYSPSLKPMQGLGYKRMCAHLGGEIDLDEAVERTKTDTRRLARRQRTWFRAEPGASWTAPDAAEIVEAARDFYERAERSEEVGA